MTHTIEIESIARLDIKPGETLVVSLPGLITREVAQQVKDIVLAELPEGVKVLVKSADVDLQVVAGEALRPPPTDTDWLETENVGPM